MVQMEISQFDLSFEMYRLQNRVAERALLASILENGIRDPLQGVDHEGTHILLNGFKRYRCAKKLNIGIVPYQCLATDVVVGIVELIRISNSRSLSILEQAKLIDELKTSCNMSTTEIARLLEKSKAWVSVRTGIINEMSPTVMDKIFRGEFPVYAYMYTIRPFMRINKIKSEDIDTLVQAISDKHLSLREIELLANAYFKGSDEFRRQIEAGHITWGLNILKDATPKANEISVIEQAMLRDLELCQKNIHRLVSKTQDQRYKNNNFFAQANLLSGGILRLLETFKKMMEAFHDRSGKA